MASGAAEAARIGFASRFGGDGLSASGLLRRSARAAEAAARSWGTVSATLRVSIGLLLVGCVGVLAAVGIADEDAVVVAGSAAEGSVPVAASSHAPSTRSGRAKAPDFSVVTQLIAEEEVASTPLDAAVDEVARRAAQASATIGAAMVAAAPPSAMGPRRPAQPPAAVPSAVVPSDRWQTVDWDPGRPANTGVRSPVLAAPLPPASSAMTPPSASLATAGPTGAISGLTADEETPAPRKGAPWRPEAQSAEPEAAEDVPSAVKGRLPSRTTKRRVEDTPSRSRKGNRSRRGRNRADLMLRCSEATGTCQVQVTPPGQSVPAARAAPTSATAFSPN